MLATKPRIKTAVTTEQSQKLMQTMLTMSFGCLAFLRGLFPDDSFVDQRFVPAKCENDYDKTKTNPSNSIKIKTLVRGKSQEVGLLLDWLEKGVFKSVKLGYLRSVSLGIYLDENDPTNLCENYVFNFEYGDDNTVHMNIEEMSTPPQDVEESTDTPMSLFDSRKMAQQVMRRFIIITQSLEPLPPKKYLSMRLLFNEKAEQEYQPDMFKDATFDRRATLKIPIDSTSAVFRAGEVNTSHHSVKTDIYSTSEELRVMKETSDNRLKEGVHYEVIDAFDLTFKTDSSQGDRTHMDLDTQDTSQSPIPTELSQHITQTQTQTTKALGDFLKSPQTGIEETQVMTVSLLESQKVEHEKGSSCDCQTGCNSDSTAQKKCRACNRIVHGICYGNIHSQKVPMCFTCVSGGPGSPELQTSEYLDLMVVRKCFRYLTRCKQFPQSVSELAQKIFTSDTLTDEVNERVAFSCSIFLYDGTLNIDDRMEGSNLVYASSKTRGVTFVFDISGVKPPVGYTIISTKQYNLQFLYNNETSHPCYVESSPVDRDQFNLWLKEISDLRLKLSANQPEVCSLNSLDINDSDLKQLLDERQSRKRDHCGREDEVDEVGESSYAQLPAKVSSKRQKISISEQSLKSVW